MPPLFSSDDPALLRRAERIGSRLPGLCGESLLLHRHRGLKDKRGPVHAASFLRERRIAFDCTVREFPRIFVHELFHFAWLRLGNAPRWSYGRLLASEIRSGAKGELGWSAEWRKDELTPADLRGSSRRWREYCCESFCDTAAWLYSGVNGHPEFTLPAICRKSRRQWFARELGRRALSI